MTVPRLGNVAAIMSMSLNGYVADRNDGVAEVFDWAVCGARSHVQS